MSLFDRLFGRAERSRPEPPGQVRGTRPGAPGDPDEQALARYRYLLRTAPPKDLERAHEEAFAQLTPEQRRWVLQELAPHAPAAEVSRTGEDPGGLARLVTRTELRQPGTLERALGGAGGRGPGMGGMLAGSLLASLAGAFVGTAIAQSLLADGAFAADEALAPEEPAPSDAAAFPEEGGSADQGAFDGDFGDFGEM